MEIVPAILARSKKELEDKIGRARPLGLTVQIDVCDNKFVRNLTWAPPDELAGILDGLPFEAHLMISDPEHAIMVWLAAGAERVFYHAEATERDELILRSAGDGIGRVGIAINPGTPVSRIVPVIHKIGAVLVMGVEPGWSGQKFMPIALEKIAAIKNIHPTMTVAVDGGVRPENAAALVRAGADVLVAGSFLLDAPDPAAALAALRAEAEKGLS